MKTRDCTFALWTYVVYLYRRFFDFIVYKIMILSRVIDNDSARFVGGGSNPSGAFWPPSFHWPPTFLVKTILLTLTLWFYLKSITGCW